MVPGQQPVNFSDEHQLKLYEDLLLEHEDLENSNKDLEAKKLAYDELKVLEDTSEEGKFKEEMAKKAHTRALFKVAKATEAVRYLKNKLNSSITAEFDNKFAENK